MRMAVAKDQKQPYGQMMDLKWSSEGATSEGGDVAESGEIVTRSLRRWMTGLV